MEVCEIADKRNCDQGCMVLENVEKCDICVQYCDYDKTGCFQFKHKYIICFKQILSKIYLKKH